MNKGKQVGTEHAVERFQEHTLPENLDDSNKNCFDIWQQFYHNKANKSINNSFIYCVCMW